MNDIPTTSIENEGLYCATSSRPSVCAPIAALGSACRADYNMCGAANYCDWRDALCIVAGKLGESCATNACLSKYQCETDYKCKAVPFVSDAICQGIPSAP